MTVGAPTYEGFRLPAEIIAASSHTRVWISALHFGLYRTDNGEAVPAMLQQRTAGSDLKAKDRRTGGVT